MPKPVRKLKKKLKVSPLKKKPSKKNLQTKETVEPIVEKVAMLADLLAIHEHKVRRKMELCPELGRVFEIPIEKVTNGVMARAHELNRKLLSELFKKHGIIA